ncbi:MAG: class I SAM-dependent methyltransferase [Candidatus Altiarchaeota archaeon]
MESDVSAWKGFWVNQSKVVKYVRESYFTKAFTDYVKSVSGLGDLVLEVGCGEASGRKHIGNYVGLDSCRDQLTPGAGLFVVGDVMAMPFKDSSVDVVYSQGLLEHLGFPGGALAEMYRVSGKVVVGIVPSMLFVPWFLVSRVYPPLWPWMRQGFYSRAGVEKLVLGYPNFSVRYLASTFGLTIGFTVQKLDKVFLKDYYRKEGSLGVRMKLMYDNENKYRSWYHVRRRDLTERVLGDLLASDGVYADIGCGEGQFLEYARGKCARVVGVDLSLEYLASARKVVPDGLYVNADCEALPFRDGVLDVVGCMEVLEHVPEIGVALGELSRVSGDAVVVTLPTERANLVYRLGRFFLGSRVAIAEGFGDCFRGHVHALKPGDLEDMAVALGLRVVKLVPVHSLGLSPLMFFLSDKLRFLNRLSGIVIRVGDFLEDVFPFKRFGVNTVFVFKK